MQQSKDTHNMINLHQKMIENLHPLLYNTYIAINCHMTLASRNEREIAFKRACITYNVLVEKYKTFNAQLRYDDNRVQWVDDKNKLLLNHTVHYGKNFDRIASKQHLSIALENFELLKDLSNELLYYDITSSSFVGLSIEEVLTILNNNLYTFVSVSNLKMCGHKYMIISIKSLDKHTALSHIEATLGNLVKGETFIFPIQLWYEFKQLILHILD